MWKQIDCRQFCAWVPQRKKNYTDNPGDLKTTSLSVHSDIYWQVKKRGKRLLDSYLKPYKHILIQRNNFWRRKSPQETLMFNVFNLVRWASRKVCHLCHKHWSISLECLKHRQPAVQRMCGAAEGLGCLGQRIKPMETLYFWHPGQSEKSLGLLSRVYNDIYLSQLEEQLTRLRSDLRL